VAILRPVFHHRITPNYLGWKVQVRNFARCLCLILSLGSSSSQELKMPEYQVKAAFLFNFTKLVDWPTNAFSSSNAPLTIGVLGRDPFGKALDDVVAGRGVNGHTIQVMRFNSVEEVKDCQILFISESERRRIDSIITLLQDKPLLTVGDTKGFASRGIIELVKSNETINLRINLDAAHRAGLALSSRLTRLDKSLQPPNLNTTNLPPVITR
jgi:hypothetical protein